MRSLSLFASAALAAIAAASFTHSASAASAAYCALYAREYAAARVTAAATDNALSARQRLEDQAFSRCLNLDVEPEFPATSVYYGETTEDVIGVTPDVAEGDASFDDETPVAAEPVAAPVVAAKRSQPRPKPKTIAPPAVATTAPPASQDNPLRSANGEPVVAYNASPSDGSPLVVIGTQNAAPAAHDSDWNDWCRSHYPNSFDPKTGTVLPIGTKTRVVCPR